MTTTSLVPWRKSKVTQYCTYLCNQVLQLKQREGYGFDYRLENSLLLNWKLLTGHKTEIFRISIEVQMQYLQCYQLYG
jgi:hypothetical protein